MLKRLSSLTLVVSLFVASTSYAGLRCGNDLVSIGDNFDRVRNTCGEADAEYDMGTRVIYRQVEVESQTAGIAESIKVDMWVYRGKPNTFTRELYFENGVLVKIELGDRTD